VKRNRAGRKIEGKALWGGIPRREKFKKAGGSETSEKSGDMKNWKAPLNLTTRKSFGDHGERTLTNVTRLQ
jgi:hypothetical protein